MSKKAADSYMACHGRAEAGERYSRSTSSGTG